MFWTTYYVLKVCKQGVRIIGVDWATKKRVNIIGNLPELYHGITMSFGLERRKDLDTTYLTYQCVDYEIILTDKNKTVLEKNGVNIEDYNHALELHSRLKSQGVTWRVAKTKEELLFERLSFAQADKIHKMLVDNAEDKIRLNAIKNKIISMGRMQKKISYNIEEYLSMFDEIEKQGAYGKLTVAKKLRCLESNEYGLEKNNVLDKVLKEKEEFIFKSIERRLTTEYPLMMDYQIEEFVNMLRTTTFLAEEQLQVLYCLSDNLPCIITGGAGVGKTSVVKAVLDCYAKYYGKKAVLLLAPTGKASRRLAEKTGYPASTIHRALRKSPEDNFTYYNAENHFRHRLIVVDESSMIDTVLMYDLMSAVEENAKIIFVGDHNQLAPVGYGEPFMNFFESLEVFRLTENHRQEEGTDILENANAVLEGKPVQNGCGISINHISFEDISDILDVVGHDSDVQLISPYNHLNDQINDYLKKNDVSEQDDVFADDITKMANAKEISRYSVGDKVMTIRNTAKYCNGDIGYVTNVAKNGNITLDIEGKQVSVKKSEIDDLAFAYAITIHKMQGSEADRIVVFIPENDTLVDKHMMYTAITRARKELEIYYYSVESA